MQRRRLLFNGPFCINAKYSHSIIGVYKIMIMSDEMSVAKLICLDVA